VLAVVMTPPVKVKMLESIADPSLFVAVYVKSPHIEFSIEDVN
jgi:hypothetical protein